MVAQGPVAAHVPVDQRRMKDLSLAEVYQLIEPGPVVLLTTRHRGRDNVMTMSWHMMVEFEPPLIACVVSNRNHSFAGLRATRDCVIAIPSAAMARETVGIGNCSGREVDKFERFGLTRVAAQEVGAPLIAECFANLECRVFETRFVNQYNLFILEVRKAWRHPTRRRPKTIHHQGFGKFVVDGQTIRLASKMR